MTRKCLLVLMTIAIVFAMPRIVFALQDPSPPPAYKGNIIPNQYLKVQGTFNANGNGNYLEYIDGSNSYLGRALGNYPDSFNLSTHTQGTWNSPYTLGVDGFNYNDPQDYVDGANDGLQVLRNGNFYYYSGPHGNYLTTSHKCRECHAVHRAAGKFKLMRSNTRFEACDWCHGTGAGSGFNVETDNDDNYTTEYNVGHSMGYGISSGKWKAPDDTYPAFTPSYWLGGFSCFDCHSPHANPQRMLGYNDNGIAVGKPIDPNWHWDPDPSSPNPENPQYILSINDPGHDNICNSCHRNNSYDRITVYQNQTVRSNGLGYVGLFKAGSWLLIKDPDREIATTSTVVPSGIAGEPNVTITAGQEIPDVVTAGLFEFSTSTAYPVNKMPIDWNNPIGITVAGNADLGCTIRNTDENKRFWTVTEFCTDCHAGNSGLHTVQSPLFSEDRALREQTVTSSDSSIIGQYSNLSTTTAAAGYWSGEYDISYGHDQNVRHCARQMVFDPEDSKNFGPHCRNCHRGSSGCGKCHSNDGTAALWTNNPDAAAWNDMDRKPDSVPTEYKFESLPYPPWFLFYPTILYLYGNQGQTTFCPKFTGTNFYANMDGNNTANWNNIVWYPLQHTYAASDIYKYAYMLKNSRTVTWDINWRTNPGISYLGNECQDDGFSWPHRTLGWKMLKDDLFGLDLSGNVVSVGDVRRLDTGRGSGGLPDGVNETYTAHDLDSVCLDCHNPNVWRATSASNYADTSATMLDNHNDELLTRGLQ